MTGASVQRPAEACRLQVCRRAAHNPAAAGGHRLHDLPMPAPRAPASRGAGAVGPLRSVAPMQAPGTGITRNGDMAGIPACATLAVTARGIPAAGVTGRSWSVLIDQFCAGTQAFPGLGPDARAPPVGRPDLPGRKAAPSWGRVDLEQLVLHTPTASAPHGLRELRILPGEFCLGRDLRTALLKFLATDLPVRAIPQF